MIKNMHKNHLHTTLSNKHFELLKKYTEKFGTQQKALEFALESLENDTKRDLAQDEQVWVLTGKGTESACVLHKDAFKTLLEGADVKRIIKIVNTQKIAEHMVSWYYQKPLKKCSLKEVTDGVIFFLKAAKIFDTVNYVDCGNYYSLKMIHGLDIRTSKMFNIFIESLFEAYGVKTESEISEKSLFMKIYNNP
ncbi:MAG: hypothetical protein FIB08_13915 [Candidatus Methanoperedens sp.]|nr:hypothetical protein [Candidatus Methanoperedens sp.]